MGALGYLQFASRDLREELFGGMWRSVWGLWGYGERGCGVREEVYVSSWGCRISGVYINLRHDA